MALLEKRSFILNTRALLPFFDHSLLLFKQLIFFYFEDMEGI